MKFIVFFIFISFLPLFADANDLKKAEPWEFVEEDDGMKIYTRFHAGTKIKEVKANVVCDGVIQEALDVIFDRPSNPQVFKYVKYSDVLKKNETCDWTYNVVDAPLAADRDCLVKTCKIENKDGSVSVIWAPFEDKKYPIAKNKVRLLINQGFWKFTQIKPDKIRIDYYIYTDPAGDLPLWIKNIANKNSVPDSIWALNKEMTRRRKAKTKNPS